MLVKKRNAPKNKCAMCVAEKRESRPVVDRIADGWEGWHVRLPALSFGRSRIPPDLYGLGVCETHVMPRNIHIELLQETFPIAVGRTQLLADGTAAKPGMLIRWGASNQGPEWLVSYVRESYVLAHSLTLPKNETFTRIERYERVTREPGPLVEARTCRACHREDTWIRYPEVGLHWCHGCYASYSGLSTVPFADLSVYLDV